MLISHWLFQHKAKVKDSKPLPKKAMSLYKHKMGWGGDTEEFKESVPSPGDL